MLLKKENKFKNKYVPNNFYLNDEEKNLFFTLKKIYHLNNSLTEEKQTYISFIKEMNEFYKNILKKFEKM